MYHHSGSSSIAPMHEIPMILWYGVMQMVWIPLRILIRDLYEIDLACQDVVLHIRT